MGIGGGVGSDELTFIEMLSIRGGCVSSPLRVASTAKERDNEPKLSSVTNA